MATHAATQRVTSRTAQAQRWLASAAAHGPAEPVRLVVLCLAALAVSVLVWRWPNDVPRGTLAPLAVLAGLGLSLHRLLMFYGWLICCYVVTLTAGHPTAWRSLSVTVAMAAIMVAMFFLARAREGLGVYGTTAEHLLRALHTAQGQFGAVPALPEGWQAECAVDGAYGDAFRGDIILCAEGFHRRHAEFALVDVSGKGLRAGTRGMTTSAALSGLLGQVEPWRFLDAANTFLVRQAWAEGFATAVHVDLDPVFGHFSVSGAGHPPAMQFRAATGTWREVTQSQGPALGLMEGMTFPRSNGEMQTGDVLVLFTDGVIESRESDLADGIDWVGGLAERFVREGSFSGLAQELVDSARGGVNDDRAALVIWRG